MGDSDEQSLAPAVPEGVGGSLRPDLVGVALDRGEIDVHDIVVLAEEDGGACVRAAERPQMRGDVREAAEFAAGDAVERLVVGDHGVGVVGVNSMGSEEGSGVGMAKVPEGGGGPKMGLAPQSSGREDRAGEAQVAAPFSVARSGQWRSDSSVIREVISTRSSSSSSSS